MSSLSRPSASRRINIGAAILERPVIEKILTHLGVEPRPPPKAPAREPVPHPAA